MEENKIELNLEQKSLVDKHWNQMDLISLTRLAFNNDKLDGRSLEGRAVRSYAHSKSYKLKTSKYEKQPMELTSEQEEFVLNNAKTMNPLEIARVLFDNPNIHNFSLEVRAITHFIRQTNPTLLKTVEMTDERYKAPKTLSKVIQKVNEVTHENIDESKISLKHRKCLEKLLEYLHSPRLINMLSVLTEVGERDIFESEFIRATWDKPDLTTDEINLYINLINEYIIQARIQKTIAKLNAILDEIVDDKDGKISMSLCDSIKGKNSEYDDSVGRQNRLVGDLAGKRSNRMNQKVQNNKSLVLLVEMMQEKEERDRMLRFAELRRQALKEEVDTFENMDEFIVRVFGISKDEILD